MRFILFGCIRDCLVALRNSVQNVRTSAKVRATKSRRNFSQRTHPIHPIGSYIDVLVRFVVIGRISDHLVALRNSVVKQAELVQKFVPQSRAGFFCNEGTRSTPLDPKLMFWCVSYYLGAIGTVWSRYKTRCKTGRTSAKVRATKSHRNFSQRRHPIHPIGP